MTVKLIKQLLALVMAMALVGAPAVQAAFTAPCHNVVASACNNQLQSDQTSVPASMPCNGMTLACATVLHYGLNASLPVQSQAKGPRLIRISAVYRTSNDMHQGLSIKPDLGPPITI